MKTGNVDLNVRLGKPSDKTETPIFSDDFKSRIKEAHHEMSALSIGAQLELSAIKFYNEEADAVDDHVARKFYKELAEWEMTHHRQLIRQQQELQENYWQAGGFQPF